MKKKHPIHKQLEEIVKPKHPLKEVAKRATASEGTRKLTLRDFVESSASFEGSFVKIRSVHGATISDMFLLVENALRGCGFYFEGNLDIVED